MSADSDALSRIRLKTRAFIIIGTCAVLAVSGVLAIYWYDSAFERIKEISILGGISHETLESGIPNVVQYTATEWAFPIVNSTPRVVIETSYETGAILHANSTILDYDLDGWVTRLITENQQVYSNQALIEATEDTVLTILISEAALLATASTMNLFMQKRWRGAQAAL